ncbi:MAG: MFS transporter [Gammaproteobacteria bacterium]
MNSLERRSVAALAGVFSLRMFGLFMVLPMMALYASGLEGATPLMIGLALGVYGLTQAIFQIPFGMLSDRFGRKHLIVFGLVLFLIGSVVAALAQDALGVVVGRALQGSGAIAAVVLALVADLTRDQQRTKAMALMGMSIGASFLFALMAGPVLDQWVGMSGLFWMTALLAGLSIGVVIWIVPDAPITSREPGARATREFFFEVLKTPHLLRLDFGIFVLHMVLTALFVATPFALVDVLQLDRDAHWRVYVPVLLVSIILMLPLLIIGMRRHLTFFVFRIAIVALLAAFLLLFAGYDRSVWLVTGMGLFFVGFNLLEAMLPSLVTRVAPGYAKGTATGVYNTFEFSGVFIGGAIGGVLHGAYGSPGVFLFCTLATLSWLTISVLGQSPMLRESLTIRLQPEGADLNGIEKQLRLLPGVDDVSMFPKERMAYLRVEEGRFDRRSLDEIPGLRTLSE